MVDLPSDEASRSPGLYELLAALPAQLRPHSDSQEDCFFLQGMFAERSLHSLVKLVQELQNKPASVEVQELLILLDKPHVQGATIKSDENSGAVVVARIMRGGAADRSGLIHVGDELREVNGIPVDDKKPEEIIRILAQSQGAITFKIIPGIKDEVPSMEPKMFVRAFFDYDPNEDKAIPCKEAGLAFSKGDILQIMSQDDGTWWQAKHEGDANPRAGLVPSKQFQERRFAVRGPTTPIQPQKATSRRSCKIIHLMTERTDLIVMGLFVED
ncbi:hypothetical protein Z043_101634 [Scleropages formosus]|uniref:MAGUK p55 subfamily member 7 n=1 Tax=Scleropages formosus TaxID=113540 RepID=A0A0P7VXR7_SCLFO|nr:hypothetical protein Z043_101634 [Scleropages formosus]